MAYIGQNLDRFSSVEKLDAITPATATGAGPYNLTKGSVAFTPSSADTMVVSIDGAPVQGRHLCDPVFRRRGCFALGQPGPVLHQKWRELFELQLQAG